MDSIDREVLELAGVSIAKITEVEMEQSDKQLDTRPENAGNSDWNTIVNVSSQGSNNEQDKVPISVIIQTAGTMGEMPEKQQMTLFEKTAIVMLVVSLKHIVLSTRVILIFFVHLGAYVREC